MIKKLVFEKRHKKNLPPMIKMYHKSIYQTLMKKHVFKMT